MHWKIQLFRISRVAGLSLALLGLGWGQSVPVRAQDAAVEANTPAPTIAVETTSKASEAKRLAPVNEESGNGAAGNDGAGISTSDRQPTIVIGFVGGFVRRGNAVHSPVKLAARLRQEYPNGVYVEVFENHHREDAYRRILELLDAAHREGLGKGWRHILDSIGKDFADGVAAHRA